MSEIRIGRFDQTTESAEGMRRLEMQLKVGLGNNARGDIRPVIARKALA